MNQPMGETRGRVYWFTGLSGVGKSTLGRLFYLELRQTRPAVFWLDGDISREIYGADLGHSRQDREQMAMRNAKLCKALAEQGIDVVCTTISLFHSVQRWNRQHIDNYTEIYLRAPLEVLQMRDPKKIYARAQKGELHGVVGLDLPFEEPEHPDVLLENDGRFSIDEAMKHLHAKLKSMGE